MANRRRSKKWISWIIILALLVGAGVVCYLVYDSYFKDKSGEEPKPTEQTQEKTDEKTEEKKTEEKKEETVKKEEVVQYEGEDPNQSSEITGAITYAGVSGESLLIRINIDQYLNGGTCTLSLRQGGGNVYSAEAGIVDSASTSTCEGFNVPVSGLPKGKYNIVVYISSNGKTGEISGEANI